MAENQEIEVKAEDDTADVDDSRLDVITPDVNVGLERVTGRLLTKV